MQNWYEFGYNGFPSGEQRRRFYRQRDDPCDSEEERDYDDKTNDRPIFYYPLRESEDGVRSSSVSLLPSTSSDEDDKAGRRTGDEVPQMRLKGTYTSQRSRRARQAPHEDSSLRCLLHTTLYEDMPAWYGSSSVTLASSYSPHEMYTLQYGGAPCASPFAVSNQFSLWRWRLAPVPAASTPQNEAAGNIHCLRLIDDPSLRSCLQWSALHPALRLGHTSTLQAPPRIGHCVVPLASLDALVLQHFLSDHSHGAHATEASRLGTTAGRFGKKALDSIPVLLTGNNVDLYVSLVIGGASHLVDMSNSSGAGSRHSSSGVRGPMPEGDSNAFRGPNLDRVSIDGSHILSHPALCLTLIAHSVAQPRQHTIYFPLDGPSVSVLSSRAFATLTPWPDANSEELAHHSFAYIGGTENGRDPLSYLEVELFQLNLDTWVWSSNLISTYGVKPPPRFGHSVTMVKEDACLLMLGGVGAGRTYLNDLHVLDLKTRVWREVFIPFGVDLPRRAFFTAAILALPDTPLQGRSGGAHSAFDDADHTTFSQRAAAAVARQLTFASHLGQGTSPPPFLTQQGASSGDEGEGDDDIWPARVTGARSRGVLVVLGGECEGKPVTSAWACILRNGNWRRLSFPLRTQPHFSHVARSAVLAEADAERASRLLSRTDFRTALQALMERVVHPSSITTFDSLAYSDLAQEPYMAVCHGSLAQAVLLPSDTGVAQRLVLNGGSQGPPVSVMSEMSFMGTSLKDDVSLWLLTAQQQGSLASAFCKRVQHLHILFFNKNAGLSRAAQSILQSGEGKAAQPGSLSAENVRFNRFLSSCVLDGQLMEWTRLARKRLREEL
ncbi:Galactose oxidase [Leishmania braziliensis]|nr:Galactose oxidase [Leishmania braziliensis]